MKQKKKKSLFIFRRDLRLEDNTAFHAALKHSEIVTCCFIFDSRQLKNPYRSDAALQFMLSSLRELYTNLKKKGGKLYFFEGKAEDVVKKLIVTKHYSAVFLNKDYTPFSRKRDAAIEKICLQHGVDFCSFDDCLLQAPGTIVSPKGTPYTIFTAFYRRAQEIPVQLPVELSKTLRDIKDTTKEIPHEYFFKEKINFEAPYSLLDRISETCAVSLVPQGGRSAGVTLLRSLSRLKNYSDSRDYPYLDSTTHLSPHNKFGTVSIREVYWAIEKKWGKGHALITELFWRDFFSHIAFYFPQVFGSCFKKQYEKIIWKNDRDFFKAWCTGKTGFPIVDAGMRELLHTHTMHNRVRMITASFLVKDLHIDWRWGEKHFASHLVDYDPAVNNGNWQWAASTGCDAQPYFRIFNPWRQQEKFDPDCVYIKKWVPELRQYSSSQIHNWDGDDSYPAPLVDHASASKKAKEMYSS